ncbi:putative nucleotidyltransferase substrate binding domain-containing protein [Rhodococcus gannanensis]|uniref:Nucleotidyltransferase substrate binding domain-containing protein n=1 Tax=Rhodococcus gannanensis TaxID=1960308 RepID=A0ABW4P960_9NOCA
MNEPLVVRDAAMRPVAELLRGTPPTCGPDATVAEAARLMTSGRARYVLVCLDAGRLGILTEGDLRRRVLGAGHGGDVTVAQVMTAPALTTPATTLGADALLVMLTHGVRRLPVVSETGEPLGVVEDTDLLANATRGGFLLRGEIARAEDPETLVAACSRIPALTVGLWRARVAALDVSAVLSVVVEAAVRRAVELAGDESRSPTAWFGLGSIARREAVPSSDVDSAWSGDETVAAAREHAAAVHALLDRCGLRADDKGAVADRPRFARSPDQWHSAIEGWLADPFADQALVMLGMLVDSRIAHGDPALDLAGPTAEMLRSRPEVLRLLLKEAVEEKARIPARRRIVTRRPEPVDVKVHGLSPVVNIARWAGTAAGLASESTPTRLRVAVEHGLLSDDDGRVLGETFDVLTQIRLRHQCEQIERGQAPTDVVDPELLGPLQRSLLSNAVREIAGVQRTLAYAGPPA